MKSVMCVDLMKCTIVLIIMLIGLSEAELEQSKIRRGGGGTSGLFQFPRVGRSDPSLANNMHDMDTASSMGYDTNYANSIEDYEEYQKNELKRANLIAYPRIGRTDSEMRKWAHLLALQQAYDKRTVPSASSGLWFGPRLGKRSINDSHEHKAPKADDHV